jgi:aminopeptidase
MDVDYAEMGQRAAALSARLEATDTIHITTPQGTDLRLRRGDRRIICDDGLVRDFGNLPAGEVYFAPLEESVEGRLVVDKTFHQGQRISLLEIQFEGGIGTPIGAAEGFDVFVQQWEAHSGDKNRIGEMGIGINSELHTPTGYILMDEKLIGTVHLALGFNSMMGGANQSTMHWDMVLLQPTVVLEAGPILERGRFLVS